MKHLIRTLLVSVSCLGLSGCALVICMLGDTDISKDPRFKNVVGHEIPTKITLRLYAPDNGRPADMRPLYDLTDMRVGPQGLTTVVPAGSMVKFDKVVRMNGVGDSSEYSYGELKLQGRSYPIYYYLGASVYPDGWRRMYDAFVIAQ